MSDVTAPETTEPLTLFTTTWCPFCNRLKKLLDEKEISYAEIDVEDDAFEPPEHRRARGEIRRT